MNTFLGEYSSGGGITSAASGGIYVAGTAARTWGVPVAPYAGYRDAFAAKFADNGTLLWNTFLGGSGWDWGSQIAVDADGNTYVLGGSFATWGTPVRPYFGWSCEFVAKLDTAGNLVWNTFLRGVSGIVVDNKGSIYVCGTSGSSWGDPVNPFFVSSDSSDGYAAKLAASDGALVWNTFLGGSGDDTATSIALDSAGSMVICGYSSGDWGTPVRPYSGDDDVFAAKLADNGTLLWNTFLGGSGEEEAYSIAVDSAGSIAIGGYSTADWGTPLRPYSGDYDFMAAKLTPDGALVWNTFLGGSGDDSAYSVAVDSAGSIFIGGYSTADWGTPLRPYSGGYDAAAAQLTPDGALVWNSFLGSDDYDDCYGIALDKYGDLLLTGESDARWGTPVNEFTEGSAIMVTKMLLPPAVQATAVAASAQQAQADISWTRGSGVKCAVFVKQADNGAAAPADSATYSADAAFGSGSQIGSTGWYCVYNGTAEMVTVTGLAGATPYRIMVCEYKGTAGLETYNASAASGNPATFTTLEQTTTTTTASPDTTTTTTAPPDTSTTTTMVAPTTTSVEPTTTTTPVEPTTTTTVPAGPCPATQVLGEGNPELDNLRDFRDSKLARSTVGRRVIQLYYSNAANINAALACRPALRAFAGRALEVVAPMVGRREE